MYFPGTQKGEPDSFINLTHGWIIRPFVPSTERRRMFEFHRRTDRK
jgi:hypothetical protein